MSKPPVYLTAAQIAEILDSPADPWSTKRANRWLKRTGAALPRNRPQDHLRTTPELLRDHWPEIYMRLGDD